MIQRRDFVKMSVMAGAAGLIQPAAVYAAGKKKTTGYFNVHPFVENHPEAVFIMTTGVDSKTI